MSYTPMSDLGQQGLFDITRLLLQQPDLAALSETLTRLVQQSALADEAAIILWNAGNHRAARYACDEAGHPVSYEDETVLAHGPVRRLLSRPDALHCDHETFADTWPQLIRSGLYRPFGYYSLLPLAADGRIFGGCEFLRRDNRPWSVPGADDIMLNYQSTSFHDALYARRLLGLKHAPEFADWLAKMQIIDPHGALRLTDARHPLLSVLPQGASV